MSTSLKERLEEDMRTALRAGDRDRLSVIRMALAAIKRSEIDNRGSLDDSDTQGVLEKMVKQSREAADLYEQGGEPERAKKEAAEIEILIRYLPEPLTESEVAAMIDEIIRATGASSVKDMGPVMSEIRARAAGRVDMKEASNQVRTRLQGSKPG